MKIVKSNFSGSPQLPAVPWHIHLDQRSKKDPVKSGLLIHINEPKYQCRFYIGKDTIEPKGFSIHNIDSGVQLYDIQLPEGQKITSNFKAINTSLRGAASFVYDMLFLPYFRNFPPKENS